jgi:hypothetical protein
MLAPIHVRDSPSNVSRETSPGSPVKHPTPAHWVFDDPPLKFEEGAGPVVGTYVQVDRCGCYVGMAEGVLDEKLC